MGWTWAKDSILYDINKDIPPKDIFVAVCVELGRYYREKGYSFTKSRPKLTLTSGDIQLEIILKSSGFNRAGESVSLEIMPTFYCLPYVKAGVQGRGILFDHSSINSEFDLHKNDLACELIGIYGDVTSFVNHAFPTETVRYTHMCDVYGINETKFLQIIRYINDRIVSWVEEIQTESGVEEMIAIQRAKRPGWNLQNCNDFVNCSLAYYICDRFPVLAQKWDIGLLEEG
ncbi:hypothetical protein D3C75_695810 [compost metagenome]